MAGAAGAGMFDKPLGSGLLRANISWCNTCRDGAVYGEWTVAIRKVDAIYQLAWRKGDQIHFHGVGLETAHGLAVGCFRILPLAFLDYPADPQLPQQLHAIWAFGSATTVGIEILTRLNH